MIRGDWGPIQYPLVVGHEIVGTVSEVGSEVTKYQVGDRVGVGCMVNSCGECEYCRRGDEQYCQGEHPDLQRDRPRRRHHHPGRLLAGHRRHRGLPPPRAGEP
ncbi:alcohol dehydrogenase catalytic domain-containing protein [Nonomuraea sp. ZG12]